MHPDSTKYLIALDKLIDNNLIAQFDIILRHAKDRFHVPIARIAFIGKHGQWIRPLTDSPLEHVAHNTLFCAETIISEKITVIPDAREHAQFCANPLVLEPPYIRFYAGASIIIPDGLILGSLCLIDTNPRHDFGANEQAILLALSREISNHIIEKVSGA